MEWLCRFRGQKTRFAREILDRMKVTPTTRLWDVCAGTASIALRAAADGVPARNITIVEKGSWGMFWDRLLNGPFDFDRFSWWLRKIPKDQTKVSDFLKALFGKTCADSDAPYVFFILASGSYQGSAFGHTIKHNGRVVWQGHPMKVRV